MNIPYKNLKNKDRICHNFIKNSFKTFIIILCLTMFSIKAEAQFSGGNGTEANPYLISTAAQLAQLATYINNRTSPYANANVHYKLTNDIDLSDYGENWNDGKGWIPIGGKKTIVDTYEYFQGVFDGDGKKIKNLYISLICLGDIDCLGHMGLFGYIYGGTVKNLGVEDLNINVGFSVDDYCHVGGVAGKIETGSISNCYSTGSIYTHTSTSYVGGVVGHAKANVSNCYSTAMVKSFTFTESINVGGIIGYLDNGGIVSNSYSTGEVISRCEVDAKAGGVVAYNNNGTVSNCYSTGAVIALSPTISYAGGIVGYIDRGNITDCYSTGVVTSSSATNSYAGGIAGYMTGSNVIFCNVSKCYSTCTVSSTTTTTTYHSSNAGGIAGYLTNYSTISNCYSTGSVFSSASPTSSISNSYAGGIAGGSNSSCAILKCYSTSLITSLSLLSPYAGGISGTNGGNCSISDCAALNPIIVFEGTVNNIRRIARFMNTGYSFNNNVAFVDLIHSGYSSWGTTGGNTENGADITIQTINSDGSLGNRFTDTDGWTIQNGKLPGLFGNTVDLPFHLKIFEGTESDPYIITTAEELALMATYINEGVTLHANPGVHFKLGNDIDLIDYQSGEGWTPIGLNISFKGVFDGNNKIITNLYVNSNAGWVGLFGTVEQDGVNTGVVKNLGVENVNIYSDYYSGGIVSENLGLILNCYSTGSVNSDVYAGGIAGSNSNTISNCYSTSKVNSINSSSGYAGGIVAENTGTGSVLNCYSIGSIVAEGLGAYTGGIVAINLPNGLVSNCAALNPNLYCEGSNLYFGRIVGGGDGQLLNNVGFKDMMNRDGNTWNNIGVDLQDGADITSQDIYADGTLGGRFTSENGWTTESEKLPGLFGNTVEIPLYLSGEGSEEYPFIIRTADELALLAFYINNAIVPYAEAGTHFKLGANIDLTNYQSGAGWIPIGSTTNSFKGIFDGAGKIISNLKININNSTVQVYIGLFGYVTNYSIIKNIGVENVNIYSSSTVNINAGGIVGQLNSSSLINCYSTGIIKFQSTNVFSQGGGIAGTSSSGCIISNCYSACSINASAQNNIRVGGVVGLQTNSSLLNCYSTGIIEVMCTGTNAYAGGVIGTSQTGTVTNCAALNPGISGTVTNFGRVIGNSSGANIQNNIAFNKMLRPDGDTTWTVNPLNGENITVEEINSDGTIGGKFTNTNGWTTQNGKLPGLFGKVVDMPFHLLIGNGTETDPYIITSATQLAQLATYVNENNETYNDKYYKLGNDIDLSDYGKNFNNGAGWIPIGKYNSQIDFQPFYGGFDGDNKVITGLYINGSNYMCAGLFGFVTGSIKNLGVENIDINNSYSSNNFDFSNTGGIAGLLSRGEILNCYSTGTINSNLSQISYTGGIIGYNEGGNISNCYSNTSVNSYSISSYAGGIAGYNNNDDDLIGSITNCYSLGSVSCSVNHVVSVGGIVSYNNSGSVTNCAALNIELTCTGNTLYFGRIAGISESSNGAILSNNIAFNKMVNPDGGVVWNNVGLANKDGANTDIEAIISDGTLGGRFTSENGWTTQNGKLPGLFGNVVDMPFHLILGNGTEENPFIITTAEQLAQLAVYVNANNENYNDKHYKLGNDIDLSDYGTEFNNGEGWIPIGIDYNRSFKGVFNGDNKKIINLYINSSNFSNAGLFGFVTGSIKNLGVENIDITNNNSTNDFNYINTGGIVGFLSIGAILNCYSTGTINSNVLQISRTGGIIGYNGGGNVSNCYSNISVNSYAQFSSFAGGIAGFNESDDDFIGSITNCYSLGSVSYSATNFVWIGGIVGSNYSGSVINCAALNSELTSSTNNSNFGRIAGISESSNGAILSNNIAFYKMVNPDGGVVWNNVGLANKDGANIGFEAIISDGTLGGRFTSENKWTIEPGKLPGLFDIPVDIPDYLFVIDFDGGDGTEEDPYIITTPEQLAQLAIVVNAEISKYNDKHYILGNNIDLSDYGENYNDGNGWIPIGANAPFFGSFDGDNKIITGLYINNDELNDVGLFGSIDNLGIVKNLGIENIDINSNTSITPQPNTVGGVTGYNAGSITNCYTTGTIISSNQYNIMVGGIVGFNASGSVINCFSTTSVSATSIESTARVGGIAGHTQNGNILNCYSTGSISSESLSSLTSAFSSAGGIVGYNYDGSVSHCYATGAVNSLSNEDSYTGGIVGRNVFSADISNCAALNTSLNCAGNIMKFGRITGENDREATTTNNIAFDRILNPDGETVWVNTGVNGIDGIDITAIQINTDGTLGGYFTDQNVWTIENRKLPGLFGNTVDMPEHLKICLITVTINPEEGGTIEGDGMYNPGDEVYLTAIANTGYKFVNWTINGVEEYTDENISFPATEDVSLTVNFIKIHTINVSSNNDEWGTVSGGGIFEHGQEVTVTAAPETGYKFENWKIDDIEVSDEAEYKFDATEDVELIAYFEIITYIVSVTADPEEGGEVSGGGIYNHGENVSISATPNEGYNFINWTYSGTDDVFSQLPDYSFIVTEDLNLVANFQIKTYTVTVSSSNLEYGTTTGGEENIPHGKEIIITATAKDGCEFVNWIDTSSGVIFSYQTDTTFAVTRDLDLRANFKPEGSFYVTIIVKPEGAGVVEGDGIHFGGVPVVVKAIPNEGYNFVNWTGNGNEVETNEVYTFQIENDVTLTANFQLKIYSVTISANPLAGGNVSGGGNNIPHNTQITVKATPAAGYGFINWTENGNEVSKDAEYTFRVTSNRNLVANFGDKFTITVTPNNPDYGEVAGGGSDIVYNSKTTIYATAKEGYEFVSWTKTGNIFFSKDAVYEFTVTENLDLTANFKPEGKFLILLNVIPEGAGRVDGSGEYEPNKEVTITVYPNDGYKFINWTKENGELVSSNTTYKFTATQDITLIANFEIITHIVSITKNIEEGGTIEGGGTYNYGQEAILTAKPNSGYGFKWWTDPTGNRLSINEIYKISVTEDISLIANFKSLNKLLLTIGINPEGSGTVTGGGEYNSNSSVTVTATPTSLYKFVNWTKNGVEVSKVDEYTFEITEDIILVANFDLKSDSGTEITNIELSDARLSPQFDPDNNSYRLLFDCGKNEVSLTLTLANPNASIITDGILDGNKIKFNLSEPGSELKKTVTINDGFNNQDYEFALVRPFDNSVIPVWHDVLSVINNPVYNGGYSFTEYQWYSDSLLLNKLEGKTGGNFQVPEGETNQSSKYTVWLKTSTGLESFGCVATVSESKIALKVAPNPTTDIIKVEVENSPAVFTMELRNIQGVLIQKKLITTPNFEIDLNEYPTGIYLITVEGITKKIVKIN